MERILAFLPSILIIASVAGAAFFYLKWNIKCFGNCLKNSEWRERNMWKLLKMYAAQCYVFSPALEELIFRAPLIIVFNEMTFDALCGVFVLSGLHELMHLPRVRKYIGNFLFGKEMYIFESDSTKAQLNDEPSEVLEILKRVVSLISGLILGAVAGWYGIKYQSIWVAFGIHFVWNLVMPLVGGVIILLVMLLFYVVAFLFGVTLDLWDRVNLRLRKS